MHKTVYMPIGLPGIGKSTAMEALNPDVLLSSDALRYKITGQYEPIPEREADVWETYLWLFEGALEEPEGANRIALDSTFLRPRDRANFISRIPATASLVVFEWCPSIAKATLQNLKRERQVPVDVISRMAGNYTPFNASQEAPHLQVTHLRLL